MCEHIQTFKTTHAKRHMTLYILPIGVEYGGAEGLEPPKRFYKGGSAPAEILLNLIAVTILANHKTLDVAKKRQHSYIVCLFHS